MSYLGKRWRLTLFYTVTPSGMTVLSHEMNMFVIVTAGVDAGGDMSNYEFQLRSGSEVTATTYIDTIMDLLEPLWGSSAQFIRMELWASEPTSDDYVFYSVLPIGHTGSSVSANVGNNGEIITFRCQNGNSMRLQLAETTASAAPKDPYPFANAARAAFAAHVAGTSSAIVNKRASYPIAPINDCVEQNEAFWDARNR